MAIQIVMNRTGDSRHRFDPNGGQELAKAEQGFTAAVRTGPGQVSRIRSFDPNAEETVFFPRNLSTHFAKRKSSASLHNLACRHGDECRRNRIRRLCRSESRPWLPAASPDRLGVERSPIASGQKDNASDQHRN